MKLSILLVPFLLFGCTEGLNRKVKNWQSSITGLERTVTLYGHDGNKIKSWKGKFDITIGSNKVKFDVDGKRVIVSGGIVVSEETQ